MRGIWRDRDALVDMDEALGKPAVNIMDLFIDEMHDGSFNAYRAARRSPTKPRPRCKKVKTAVQFDVEPTHCSGAQDTAGRGDQMEGRSNQLDVASPGTVDQHHCPSHQATSVSTGLG
jgi:hypothetical protein